MKKRMFGIGIIALALFSLSFSTGCDSIKKKMREAAFEKAIAEAKAEAEKLEFYPMREDLNEDKIFPMPRYDNKAKLPNRTSGGDSAALFGNQDSDSESKASTVLGYKKEGDIADIPLDKIYGEQLTKAEFKKVCDTAYEKVIEKKYFRVDIQNKPEQYVFALTIKRNMSEHKYRDLDERYTDLDERIPYPMACGKAVDYEEMSEPTDVAPERVFVYRNMPSDFVKNYEEQLKQNGFANVRIPESPLYTKSDDEGKTELSVAIDVLDDTITLRTRVNHLDANQDEENADNKEAADENADNKEAADENADTKETNE